MASTVYLGGNPIAYNFDYFPVDRWKIEEITEKLQWQIWELVERQGGKGGVICQSVSVSQEYAANNDDSSSELWLSVVA